MLLFLSLRGGHQKPLLGTTQDGVTSCVTKRLEVRGLPVTGKQEGLKCWAWSQDGLHPLEGPAEVSFYDRLSMREWGQE